MVTAGRRHQATAGPIGVPSWAWASVDWRLPAEITKSADGPVTQLLGADWRGRGRPPPRRGSRRFQAGLIPGLVGDGERRMDVHAWSPVERSRSPETEPDGSTASF
jgi:hypothetical protein